VTPPFLPDNDEELDEPATLDSAFDDIVQQIVDSQGGAGAGDGGTSADFAGVSSVSAPSALSLEPDEPMSPEEQDRLRRSAISALYGDSFPLAKEGQPSNEDWGAWAKSLWERHRNGKRKRLHLIQRNRHFRAGAQWVSSIRSGPWREPPRPTNASRYVLNMIAPALNQRQQIVAEQRPGFRTRPMTQDTDDVKKAEAQQIALEYQYDQQKMSQVIRETFYWAGTDAVAFWHVTWDPDAGPWHEPKDPQTGAPTGEPKSPLGDARTEILRIEQVCVSANSTATRKPWYWVVKKNIPLADAVAQYGEKVVKGNEVHANSSGDNEFGLEGIARHGLELPGIGELFADQDTVDHYTVYCEPSEFLPEGLMLVSVGCYPIFVGPLTFGVVPLVRVTDGTSDPAFFPQATMEDWVEDQVLVNAVISRWIDSVRRNAGGALITRPKALSQETLVGGLMSVIEAKGSGSLSDSIMPLQGFSVGSDAKELLALAKKNFEDKSGWNDASRGSYSDAASGRAILAQRETLERVFAEPVNAVAQAMSEWARIVLHVMKWGYDIPRSIGVTGHTRTDLAQSLHADDFDTVADVEIDPETLMPMPRALRLFLLDQMFERGVLTPQEYRRRLPYAYTRNIDTPDEDHQARARRISDAIRNGRPAPPIIWQDNEAIHQDVLEREILLQDNLDEQVKAVAQERWVALANQSMMKMGGMPPAAPAGPVETPNQGPSLPATEQPMLATNPGVATAPVSTMTGFAGEMNQKALMDRTQPY
jgi:hypothetical protein